MSPRSPGCRSVAVSGSEKIDSIYNSVHDIEKVVKLIGETKEYLSSVSVPKQLKLAIDALAFSTDAITDRLKCISNCSNNTKEKKDAQLAHSKLSKKKPLEDAERKFILQRTAKDNPRGALMAELKAVKESLAESTSLSKNDENEPPSLLPRKRPRQEEEVRIPRPANGSRYSRPEAVKIYHRISNDIENQDVGDKRIYLSKVKQLMIDKQYVPVQRSALNELFSKHGRPGQLEPTPYWNQKGRPEYLPAEDFIAIHSEHQDQRSGHGWQLSDTKATVFLYHDKHRSSICHVGTVYGKDQSFWKCYRDDSSKSKASATEFALAYPSSKPFNPEGGGWKGLFSDLTMHTSITVEPNVEDDEDDCLTQTDGSGLFDWSDTTLQKLKSARIAGVTTLKEKQIVFALHMLQFTYELMMKRDDCVASNPFKRFMGGAVALQKSRDVRQAGASTDDE